MRFYASRLNLLSLRNSLNFLTKPSRTSRTNLHTNSQRVKLNVLIQNKMSRARETYHISRVLLIFDRCSFDLSIRIHVQARVLKIFSVDTHTKDTTPGLQNIPQVPGNWAEVGQNHNARKVVSATRLVLKWKGAIFRPTTSKMSIQKVLLHPFHCKPRPSEVSLESPGLENISRFREIKPKLVKVTMCVKRSRLLFQS